MPHNDKVEDIILSELQYIRGKIDSVSTIVTEDHQKLEDHIKIHDDNPGKISAFCAVISCVVAVIVLGFSVYNSKKNEEIKTKLEYVIPKD